MLTPELIEEKRLLIDERMQEIIPLVDSPEYPLFEAARYSLLSPGKRLRPILLLSVLEDFRVPLELGLTAGCAIEMVHTYSLIHDDLPCMDDDDLRRGRPSLHKVYNEGHAVLTGDFLLTYAFEILTAIPNLSEKKKLSLLNIIAIGAGGRGMIGGQVVDLASEGKHIDEDTLLFMYSRKTAYLFAAALECGGVISDADERDLKALRSCGIGFGMGYQILDDLMESSEKIENSDLKNQKATSLSMYGEEKAKRKFHDYFTGALEDASSLSRPMPALCGLIESMVTN